MIDKFVTAWEARKGEIRAALAAGHPGDYKALVTTVVRALGAALEDGDYERPDPERVHQIDDGDYQGTLVFVIAATGYQPSTYWYVMVSYGSCSGCDTLEAIKNYDDAPPTAEQLDKYMTLALHIVQGLKETGGETI